MIRVDGDNAKLSYIDADLHLWLLLPITQALEECKPDFIRRSKFRVEILRQIQEERMLYSDMQKVSNLHKWQYIYN